MTSRDSAAGKASDVVLFLETNGGGLTPNLQEVQRLLLRTRPDLELRYLILKAPRGGTEREIRNPMVHAACRRARYIICSSDSLPAHMHRATPDTKRILIQPIRQYMLREAPPQGPSAGWSHYTDIVTQNEFVANAVRSELDSASVNVHAMGLPVADRFASEEEAVGAMRALRMLTSRAEGRKIITLSTMRDADTVLGDVDFTELTRRISPDYFLVIRAPRPCSLLKRYPATLSDSVFDAVHSLRKVDHLLFSDILVTTVFADAALFATSRRQVRFLGKPDEVKGIGSHLPERFADLMLSSLSQLPESLVLPEGERLSQLFADTYAGPNDGQAARRLVTQLLGQ